MKKDQRNLIIGIAVVAIIAVAFGIYFIPTTNSQIFSGIFDGSISMKVEGIDENGNVVALPQQKPLVFVAEGTRITNLRLTVTWEVTDVQAGMNTSTFFILGNMTVRNNCTWGTTSWTTTGNAVALSSSTLNNSQQWTFNLKSSPLDLQGEANKHPNDRTDFSIIFSLDWQASMVDSLTGATESEAGNLSSQSSVYYTKAFKITVR